MLRSATYSPFVKSVTIGASIAIGAFAALLAIIFVVFYKRMANRKRQYNVYNMQLPRPQQPALRISPHFPAEMKPAYLDSPRPRHSSVVAEPIGLLAHDQVLSPLAASQQPGFVPRPVPVSVPVSCAPSLYFVPHSRAASVQFSNVPLHYSYGVPPEDLVELLDELSRHYVLTDPASPGALQQRHHHSASLTGRPRGEFSTRVTYRHVLLMLNAAQFFVRIQTGSRRCTCPKRIATTLYP